MKKNNLGSPRSRVKGDGPHRKFLPTFKSICKLPEDVSESLVRYYLNHHGINDLVLTKDYKISEVCSLNQVIPQNFEHLLLTTAGSNDPVKEESYTEWRPDTKETLFYEWFQEFFPNAFRIRISVLHPGTEFPWHIDTNTSVACRCSVALNNVDSKFEIRARGKVYDYNFKRNEVVFTNTAWPHRVFNPSDSPRINLVFSLKFEGLKQFMTPSRVSLY